MKIQAMNGFWLNQYQAQRQRDGPIVWLRAKISSFWGQQMQCLCGKHLFLRGYEGKISNFLAAFQTTSSHSLQPRQYRCIPCKFHVVLPLQYFNIDFCSLVCKYFHFFRNAFSTIPILGNIIADDKFLDDTIITNIFMHLKIHFM